jgi:rhodanese-related sulfurtransferase
MKNQTLVKEICPTTTQRWGANGALLVDLREANEVAELAYDVPNLMHIPVTQFEELFAEIPKDRDVVMVCKSGGRSLRAAGFLVNYGYDNVVNMKHGLIRWAQKGFPTKGNTSSILENTATSSSCDTSSSENKKSCCNDSPKSESSCC